MGSLMLTVKERAFRGRRWPVNLVRMTMLKALETAVTEDIWNLLILMQCRIELSVCGLYTQRVKTFMSETATHTLIVT